MPTRPQHLDTINRMDLEVSDKSCIFIHRHGNNKPFFRALVDTGSPVNLIRKSIYKTFCGHDRMFAVRKKLNLRGINNSAITIPEKIYEQIGLDKMNKKWFDVILYVVEDETMPYDVPVGRKFFVNAKIKLIYKNGEYLFEYPEEKMDEIDAILPIDAVVKKNKWEIVSERLDSELDWKDRQTLVRLLQEVDETVIEPVDDGYNVRINLKDESLFIFAPRRMSFSEKQKLDTTTDNLLEREIIKPSVLPYCSRVVLVNKRNSTKRICVDLRLLNQRIYPQKFPFPIIEDLID